MNLEAHIEVLSSSSHERRREIFTSLVSEIFLGKIKLYELYY